MSDFLKSDCGFVMGDTFKLQNAWIQKKIFRIPIFKTLKKTHRNQNRVSYITGVRPRVADCLSRHPTGKPQLHLSDDITLFQLMGGEPETYAFVASWENLMQLADTYACRV